ncbi:hypothetical protein ROA7450_03464 [Roseovarius albus]|uniref:Uncharacterized protein n=1 Tax=Roseovarius albus TaxID=1247867 RepID=A0A1X6ZZ18_9RHOB|nr:hypothetical protein ROA7450_03464 [Roseovarius albus]
MICNLMSLALALINELGGNQPFAAGANINYLEVRCIVNQFDHESFLVKSTSSFR